MAKSSRGKTTSKLLFTLEQRRQLTKLLQEAPEEQFRPTYFDLLTGLATQTKCYSIGTGLGLVSVIDDRWLLEELLRWRELVPTLENLDGEAEAFALWEDLFSEMSDSDSSTLNEADRGAIEWLLATAYATARNDPAVGRRLQVLIFRATAYTGTALGAETFLRAAL